MSNLSKHLGADTFEYGDDIQARPLSAHERMKAMLLVRGAADQRLSSGRRRKLSGVAGRVRRLLGQELDFFDRRRLDSDIAALSSNLPVELGGRVEWGTKL